MASILLHCVISDHILPRCNSFKLAWCDLYTPNRPLFFLHVLQLPFTTPTGIGILQLFSSNSSSFPSNSVHQIFPRSPSHPFLLPLLLVLIHLPCSHDNSTAGSPILDFPWLAWLVTSYISPLYLNTLSVLSASTDKISCIPLQSV